MVPVWMLGNMPIQCGNQGIGFLRGGLPTARCQVDKFQDTACMGIGCCRQTLQQGAQQVTWGLSLGKQTFGRVHIETPFNAMH